MLVMSTYKITKLKSGDSQTGFDTFLNIFWQLSGSSYIFNPEEKHYLKEDELYLLSPSQMFSYYVNSGTLLHFSFFPEGLCPIEEDYSVCNIPPLDVDSSKLKEILSSILDVSDREDPYNNLMIDSLILLLFHELLTNYHTDKTTDSYDGSNQRLPIILSYLNTHYREKISLEELSKVACLSSSYIPQFFRRNLKMTISDYIKMVRLNHAHHLLVTSEKTVETIAEESGFPNIHSFSQSFNESYGMKPTKYRKTLSSVSSDLNDEPILKKYQHYDYSFAGSNRPDISVCQALATVSVTKSTPIIKNKFCKILNAGDARNLIKSNMQDILRQTIEEIPFEYIYISRLLFDDMTLYHEQPSGDPFLVFSNLDTLCDMLMSLSAKPIFELAYMPRKLADKNYMLHSNENDFISMPNDFEKWDFLVRGIATHLGKKYGVSWLKNCLFSIWPFPNEADVPYYLEPEQYFMLYQHTYKNLKEVNPSIQVCALRFSLHNANTDEWLCTFFSLCKEHDCLPDFIGYDIFEIMPISFLHPYDQESGVREPLEYLPMHDFVNKLMDFTRELTVTKRKLSIIEWNFCFTINPLNDSIFRAIYILSAFIDYLQDDLFLGCSNLSDFGEFSQFRSNIFWGGRGLFTENAIPKASFFAYKFLSYLGPSLIKKGKNWCITKAENNDIQILLFNFQPFCTLPPYDLPVLEKYEDFFDMQKQIDFQITLTDLPCRKYSRVDMFLNRSSGSSYDFWVETGCPSLDNPVIYNHMIHQSYPRAASSTMEAHDQTLEIKEQLAPLEARLILLTALE